MSSADPHPADKDKAKQHPHIHVWVPITNEWGDVTGHICECGMYRSAWEAT